MPGVKNLQERELSSLQQYQAGSKTQQSNKQIKRKNPVWLSPCTEHTVWDAVS